MEEDVEVLESVVVDSVRTEGPAQTPGPVTVYHGTRGHRVEVVRDATPSSSPEDPYPRSVSWVVVTGEGRSRRGQPGRRGQ